MDVKRILGIVILAAGALIIGMLVGQTWFYITGDETMIPTWWRGANFSGVVQKYDGKTLEVYDAATKKTMEFAVDTETNFIGGSDYMKDKDVKIIVKYRLTRGKNLAKKVQPATKPKGETNGSLSPGESPSASDAPPKGSPVTGSPSPAGSPVETGTPAPSHT